VIARVYGPAIVNAFANHPEILPDISDDGELDLSPAVQKPNVAHFGAHGGLCWVWTAPDTYEGHVMLTKAGRGKWGISAGRQSVAMMQELGARQLWCRVHPDKPHIGVFAAALGLRDTGQFNVLDAGQGPVRWRIFNWSL